MAGLQVVAGASVLAELLPDKLAALVVVGVAAMQVGTATYVHGLATPTPPELK